MTKKEPKLFVPLSHNGSGMGPMDVIPLFIRAFNGREVEMRVCGDSHADRAMNRVSNDFIRSDCDEMLIIDIDVTFTARHIEWLLSHDVPLVYGIYPKKQEDTPPCLCGMAEGMGIRDVPGDDILKETRRAGRGFMRVRREVFEAMKEDNGGPAVRFHNHGRVEWNFFQSGPVVGVFSAQGEGFDEDGFPLREWISEDWYFCERAHMLGFKVLIDPRITLGHIGQKEYRFSKEQLGPPQNE